MLSLLKKKPEADTVSVELAWHPNFRNFERLPDTKVVRTAFFINGVAVVIALVLLVWFVYQEYELHDVNRQISEWQSQIDRDKPSSDQAIALYKNFQTEAARVSEVDAFIKSRPFISGLLMRLGSTLPNNVALDTFEIRETGLNLRATVRGAPELASGYASAYLEQLRADTVLLERFDDMQLVNLSRNAQTGRLAIEISLKYKATDKDAKKP